MMRRAPWLPLYLLALAAYAAGAAWLLWSGVPVVGLLPLAPFPVATLALIAEAACGRYWWRCRGWYRS